jgi:hypothetical protein
MKGDGDNKVVMSIGMEFRSDIENLYERDSNTGGSIGIFYDI